MIRALSILIISLLSISATVSAVGYGDTPAWYWYTYPSTPPDGNCEDDIFTNITPSNGAIYVYTSDTKGVLICVNITPPSGCNITITLQWFNWTQYLNDFLIWTSEQPWGDYYEYDDWVDDIDWSNQTSPTNSSYWYNFTSPTLITSPDQLCAYNTNVSCLVENDWTTEYFDWRINYTLNCSGNITTDDCYYWFEPSLCPDIRYISPPSPNGTICPCCADMCITVNNALGNPMNLTFYRNDSQFPTFYIINQFHYVSNGTYCFCIDGHINNSLYYPMLFNTTYNWYVNITNTVTNYSVITDTFTFRTYPDPSWCCCGPEELLEAFEEFEYTDRIQDDTWIVGLVIIALGLIFVKKRTKRGN